MPATNIFYSQDDVIGERWDHCSEDAVVILYTILEGKHRWPGSLAATQTIEATDTIWEFFSAHPLRIERNYLPLVER